MKQKTRKLLFVLMTISCIFTNISIGFSTWVAVESQTISSFIDIFTEDVVNLKDAFTVTTKDLKMGKYLYEEDNTSSINGTLRYDFKVNINKLPSYMVDSEGNCTMKFSGDFSFSDSSATFFTNQYISGVSFTTSAGTSDISVSYENSKLVLDPFTLSITGADNTFSISFIFTQKCILDQSIKSLLTNEDNYFKLSLLCGGA